MEIIVASKSTVLHCGYIWEIFIFRKRLLEECQNICKWISYGSGTENKIYKETETTKY